jgi:hypothetical protein
MTALHAVRVLVVGGSYAGLGTALNLLHLSLKRTTRFGTVFENPISEASTGATQDVPIDIHIVDERDGYGEFLICVNQVTSLITEQYI